MAFSTEGGLFGGVISGSTHGVATAEIIAFDQAATREFHGIVMRPRVSPSC
tara:strand:- start:8637 stop:8789 length:153 start_codon:yes stop_codon:yes gene_type:complete